MYAFVRPSAFVLAVMASQPLFPQSGEAGSTAAPPAYDTMNLQCNIGSIKCIDGEGRLTINFTGTILIVDLEGQEQLTGDYIKEYDKNGRRTYYGTGTITVNGKWRAVQWFGSDMTATWNGRGVMRVSGEFDRNLQTGRYWFDDPAEYMPFPASATNTVIVPQGNPYVAPGIEPKARGE